MPALARVGDKGVPHCSPFTIATGSPDVFVNGRPAAFSGSMSSPHLIPFKKKKCLPHVSNVLAKPRAVFINGLPAACVGDTLTACTAIATGSLDVFILG
jgi:uncharacterized Zn-binding protein involved in type VI secretion